MKKPTKILDSVKYFYNLQYLRLKICQNLQDRTNKTFICCAYLNDSSKIFWIDFTFIRSSPKSARKITQVLAVVAVSFGAYIHGTTVVYPAVAIPSLKKSNGSNQKDEDAVLPFHITDDDISLIG